MTIKTFAHLSDRELLEQTERVAASERSAVVELIELLGEVDARKLYLPEGCRSLFTYCTQVLRLSESEAYFRIEAARAAREFPVLLDRLRDGSITLTTIKLLRPQLRETNADALIDGALHKSKRDVERDLAALAPKPDVKSVVRRLPEPQAAGASLLAVDAETPSRSTAPAPAPRSLTAPLSCDRYLLRVTLNADAHAKLQRAQDLLRHAIPSGDPAAIVERGLTLLVEDLERRRLAKVRKPRHGRSMPNPSIAASSRSTDESTLPIDQPHLTRYVSASIRREVWARDGGRCAFVGRKGRCTETGQLELHHVTAFALGGATTTDNLALRCRAHNQYEGALLFGFAHSGLGADAGTRSGAS